MQKQLAAYPLAAELLTSLGLAGRMDCFDLHYCNDCYEAPLEGLGYS